MVEVGAKPGIARPGQPEGQGTGEGTKTGRKQSIPATAFGLVFKLYSEGYGYRRISSLLAERGINTSRSSVERLVKGQPPYQGRRVV